MFWNKKKREEKLKRMTLDILKALGPVGPVTHTYKETKDGVDYYRKVEQYIDFSTIIK